MIKLESTQLQYELTHPSGYMFKVTAVWDEEFGWTAHVTMTNSGLKTAEAAVEGLSYPAKFFLKALEEGVKRDE